MGRIVIATGDPACSGNYGDKRLCDDSATFRVWPWAVGFMGFDLDDTRASCAQHLSQLARAVLAADARPSTVGVELIGKGV